jgi:serine/threonine-protein kinase
MSARLLLDDPDATRPQRRLGKYQVTGVLGEGAMGIVYRAIDPDIHRVVAIKAIRAPLLAPLADDVAAAQRFRNEARAAGRLNHPNIVSVYDFVESAGEALIVMEHVEGESLHDLTRHGERLPLDDALSIVGQLLDALGAAHAERVWHRDVKPANLLITPQGRLKVTDFGIARIESTQVTQQGKVIGSPGYMAPERYGDQPTDHRVDLFSAGVLLYELLTGVAPFRGSPSQVMNQVLTGQALAPSALPIVEPPPAAFDAVVAKALAVLPDDRFADAASMRDAIAVAARRPLRPVVQPETLVRLRAARPEAPTQWLSRRPLRRPPAPTPAPPPPIEASPPPAEAATRIAPIVLDAAPSLPVWDARVLDRLTALLVVHMGPMAVLMVRQAARQARDGEALLAQLDLRALGSDEHAAFMAKARAVLAVVATPAAPAGTPPGLPAAPADLDTPLPAELLLRTERWLTVQLGPIARVVVRRASERSTTRDQFFTALADQLAGTVDRQRLLEQLGRLSRTVA